MSKEEKYYTFPLKVLRGHPNARTGQTPLECLELAMHYGVVNAGIGYYRKYDEEDFDELLERIMDNRGDDFEPKGWQERCALVGGELCGMIWGADHNIRDAAREFSYFQEDYVPFLRMKSSFLWNAINTARWEEGDGERPERTISWREFRILCAILSVKINGEKFAFIGWEEIQARSCGMLRKEFKKAKKIPEHLTPPYSQYQIKRTCDKLENLNFFARCRHSTGKRGGFMAYSFRHSHKALREAVSRWAAFRRMDKVKENRALDMKESLKNKKSQ